MSLEIHTIPEAHEILMAQLPDWFKPVLEYIAIMQAYSGEMVDLESLMARIQENFFVQTADSQTLTYWENMLDIPVNTTAPIDFRRERIMLRLNQRPPITIWHIRDKLTELFGNDYGLKVDPVRCTMTISVTSERYGAIDLLYDVINELVPAHLAVKANQQVTNNISSTIYIAAFTTRTFEQTIGRPNAETLISVIGDQIVGGVVGVTMMQSI